MHVSTHIHTRPLPPPLQKEPGLWCCFHYGKEMTADPFLLLVFLASNKSLNLSLFRYPNHPKKESSQKHRNTQLILRTKCQQNHLGYGSGKNDDSSS